jgi:hypothetical protein
MCKKAAGPAFLLILFALSAGFPQSAMGEEIDRVLASVNGNIITRNDLRMARDLNLVLEFGRGEPAGTSSQNGLDRIVDLELIRQELENFPLASDDRSGIEAQIAELRKAYVEIGGLESLLFRLGLQQEEVEDYIHLQASIKRFVHLRFNPFVSVSTEEVNNYYRDELVPRLRKAGAPVPGLAEVAKSIEQILTEIKVNASLESWIRDLRNHSRIEILESGDRVPDASAGSVPSQRSNPKIPGQNESPRIGRVQR